MKKAFVFTMDVLLAFLYVSTFMIVIYENIPVAEDLYKDTALYEYSLDLLAMLDKNGYLSEVAEKDLENVQELISETPEQYCFNLRVLDDSSKKVATVKKHNCKGKKSVDVYTRRLFVKDGNVYMAELGAWYKLKKVKGED